MTDRRELRPLVFDLDGTLIDSRRDIARAVNAALEDQGKAALAVETVTRFVGRGAKALLRDIVGEVREAELEAWFQAFQRHYLEDPVRENSFMPGALSALGLRDKRCVALCTNKPLVMTRRVLECLGWEDFFDVVVAPSEDEKKKPDKEPLLRVARALDVAPSRLIMVGDAPPDVGAGKAAGAVTVGVFGGFVTAEVLGASGPDFLLNTLEELPGLLALQGL